jgi:hypothetical protein
LNPDPKKRSRPEDILLFEGFNKFKEDIILGKEVDIGYFWCIRCYHCDMYLIYVELSALVVELILTKK